MARLKGVRLREVQINWPARGLPPSCCSFSCRNDKEWKQQQANYVKILMKVSDEYGVKQNDSAIFQLFNSKKYGGKDLMFKDSTIKLGDVSQKTYQKLLGDLYMKDLEALDDCVFANRGKQ
ncbi:positive regulation of extracellular matrix disassembly [Desmophyllum pertusum]|uniref:Positive regulation of extracellular matrix disassembly n=1 Tax=Desmophyllum pertusum TaxID=174260 RepID=A0A9W9ZVE6_9CNID|nr:positive regulation of extracellular matrix disassembly [Desmophyllum pertusum]